MASRKSLLTDHGKLSNNIVCSTVSMLPVPVSLDNKSYKR